MAIEVKLPELGPEIESGDVLEILVQPGETVEKDQGIVEVETDKATVSVPCPQAGVVGDIKVAEGDTIAIGAVIMTLEASGADSAQSDAGAAPPAANDPPITPAKKEQTPKAAESIEKSAAPQPLTPPVNKVEETPANSERDAATPAPQQVPSGGPDIAAGPAIRRFAREVGVDLRRVTGSGQNGRITRDDVLHVVRAGGSSAGKSVTDVGTESDEHGPIRTEKLSRMRKSIAEQMHKSWSTCPRVTNFDDADVTDLEEFRQESKADYASQGIKLTTMPFLIKAIALALKNHPIINSSIDMEAGVAIYKEYVNIGIAVDTDRGLVVPSLRNADKKSIPDIARELASMAEKVRNNDFTVEDLRGSTFTLSNLGAIGGTYSTPIINIPETSILLVGRSRKMPVVLEDNVVVRLMMPLSISYDHRMVDGAAAARFLNEVIGYLKAPSRLLLAP